MAVTFDAATRPDMSAFLRRTDDGGTRLDLLVTGARCAGCIAKIEREMARLPGVSTARLNLSTGRLALGLEGAAVDPGRIISALERLGYDGYFGCEYKPKAGTSEGLSWMQPFLRSAT